MVLDDHGDADENDKAGVADGIEMHIQSGGEDDEERGMEDDTSNGGQYGDAEENTFYDNEEGDTRLEVDSKAVTEPSEMGLGDNTIGDDEGGEDDVPGEDGNEDGEGEVDNEANGEVEEEEEMGLWIGDKDDGRMDHSW